MYVLCLIFIVDLVPPPHHNEYVFLAQTYARNSVRIQMDVQTTSFSDFPGLCVCYCSTLNALRAQAVPTTRGTYARAGLPGTDVDTGVNAA